MSSEHEAVENVFKGVKSVVSRAPDCIESREAKRLLDVAEQLTHQAEEKRPRS